MYEREIKNRIKKVNETFRVLVVTGPRQVGKTTLLKSLMPKNMTYVTLDDIKLREEARENPKMFLENYKKPLYIDEVQYAPELFPYIKMEVDECKDRGQYWLSGSQRFNLMANVTESLAGRVGIVNMNSFTYSEIMRNTTAVPFDPEDIKQKENIDYEEMFKIIFRGSMPELFDYSDIDKIDFYNSYIKTYIERDVKSIKNIGDLDAFKNFMTDIAARTGTMLNYSDIARELGISSNTIKSWVSILEATGLIYLLSPYSSSKIKRLTHQKKIIFMDLGLATYLAGYQSARELQLSDESGRFLESYIISEIIKKYENFGLQLNISHLRNKETEEIDLIIEKNRKLYPIEIKKTLTPKREMAKNFLYLEQTGLKVGNGGIVCFTDKLYKFEEGKYFIPISSIINTD